ncbi:MAG: hypothetical protein MUF38_13800 [Anaerolineae bacterium]|nr:hypothetical protein [Anaerolineae bacterium]
MASQFLNLKNSKNSQKTDPQKLSYPGAWQWAQGTIEDLATHISKGNPWMPARLSGNGRRWQSNETRC